jgi:hypothetical protein
VGTPYNKDPGFVNPRTVEYSKFFIRWDPMKTLPDSSSLEEMPAAERKGGIYLMASAH